jgi:hypothetical protein
MLNKIWNELKVNFWFRLMVLWYIIMLISLLPYVGKREMSTFTLAIYIKGMIFIAGVFFVGFKTGEKYNSHK